MRALLKDKKKKVKNIPFTMCAYCVTSRIKGWGGVFENAGKTARAVPNKIKRESAYIQICIHKKNE